MTTDNMKVLKEILRSIAKRFESCGKDGSTCCGITKSQWDVLVEVGSAEELSLVELAEMLNLDTSTLSRTVNGMVMTGLLERVQSVTDRRFVTIRLKDNGKALLAQIDDIYEKQLVELLKHIPEPRQVGVIEALSDIAVALEKSNRTDDSRCC